ncbi:MAG: acetylglutamate kinase [Thermoplasmata archaeon]
MDRIVSPSKAPPLVIKIGGREILPGPALDALCLRLGGYRADGRDLLLVHGGGEEITDRADALGLRTSRLRGQRITSAPMLEIVLEVLAGRINGRLTAALTRAGVPAAGLTGAADGLLRVRPAGDPPGALGFVGTPESVRPRLLHALRAAGFVPVLAPLGIDADGQLYNVNADLAAAAIAAALAGSLWLLTDVPGVRDGSGRVLPELTALQARRQIARGHATGGMIPKLEAAEEALRGGARSVWIGCPEALDRSGPRAGTGTWIRAARRKPSSVPLPAPDLVAAPER